MPANVVIVADDLTGAADSGIAFASHGLRTVVLLRDGDGDDADVVAIDANTRDLAPEQAAAETARIVAAHSDATLFKKIDSTLRGHVGAELAATLEARRRTDPSAIIVLAPAFPATGRTTIAGTQFSRGAPVGDLVVLVKSAGLVPKKDVIVCDAETEEDLACAGRIHAARGKSVIWAGSGGLARHLPAALGFAGRSAAALPKFAITGPILFVVGSPSPVSRQQADALELVVYARRDLLVRMRYTREASSLAAYAADLEALVLTGGETARAVLEAFGIPGLRLIGEVEPGVPLSMTVGARSIPVITKSGAFGGHETLVRCREVLRAQ